MPDETFTDVFGDTVVLAGLVRSTILEKHPEVVDFIDRLAQVLGDPDDCVRARTTDVLCYTINIVMMY